MVEVSVILPTYNRMATLPRAIDSILAQTLKDIELIIVNDGSTDATDKILHDYSVRDKRIKVITQKNGGCGVARNNAVAKASGKYIAFMDSDDACAVNRLEVQVGFLKANPQHSACACSLLPMIEDYHPGIVADANYSYRVYDKSPFHTDQWFNVLGPHSVMTRESFLREGGQRTESAIIGDLDFTLRYTHNSSWVLLRDLDVYFYTSPSITNKGEVNKDILLYPKRHICCYVSEWCRINGKEDPVAQGKSLEEILSLTNSMSIADKVVVYRNVLHLTHFLSLLSDMSTKKGREYLLGILSNSKLERFLIDFKLKSSFPVIYILKAWWRRIKTSLIKDKTSS